MTLKNGHVEFAGWIIHLQAAIEGSPYGYDGSLAKYDAPGVVYDDGSMVRNWVTIDCQLTRVTAEHGGRLDQIPGMRASLGRLTADLYDPQRLLDPASTTYELLMRPGAPVRLVAIQPGTAAVWPLWSGIAETFEHNLLDGTGQLVASDLIALFTGVDVASWQRPNENAAQRLQAIRTVMPNPIPIIFSGTPTSLSAAQFSGNLWSAVVENTGEAEQSIIWVDQQGRLRRTETQGLGPPVKATDCDDGTTPIIYTQLTSLTDDDLLANIVQVERTNLPQTVDREPRQYNDPTSVSYNGPHTLSNLTLPLLDDTALANWAAAVLSLRAKPAAGISGLAVTITDAFPWVARTVPAIVALQVASVLDVSLTSRGEPERWAVAVAGIRHTIVPDSWEVEIETVDGPRIVENWGYDAAPSIYDTTVYARNPGVVGPSLAQIEAALIRVLAEEVAAL